MASEKQIQANRANARHSSGPRTKLGKARASQNARKHGLAAAMIKCAALSATWAGARAEHNRPLETQQRRALIEKTVSIRQGLIQAKAALWFGLRSGRISDVELVRDLERLDRYVVRSFRQLNRVAK